MIKSVHIIITPSHVSNTIYKKDTLHESKLAISITIRLVLSVITSTVPTVQLRTHVPEIHNRLESRWTHVMHAIYRACLIWILSFAAQHISVQSGILALHIDFHVCNVYVCISLWQHAMRVSRNMTMSQHNGMGAYWKPWLNNHAFAR